MEKKLMWEYENYIRYHTIKSSISGLRLIFKNILFATCDISQLLKDFLDLYFGTRNKDAIRLTQKAEISETLMITGKCMFANQSKAVMHGYYGDSETC